MKTTKTSTIFLAIAAVLTLGVAAAQAQETVNVKMTFSGTAVDNTVINILPNTSDDEDTFAGAGTLGSFTLHNVRAISNTPSTPPSSSTCDLFFTESAGAGVLRFQDGSLLYLQLMPGEGGDCINFATNSANCTLTFQIVGGTGRLQGAKGVLNFHETVVTLLSDNLGNPIDLAAAGQLTGQLSIISGEYGHGGGY